MENLGSGELGRMENLGGWRTLGGWRIWEGGEWVSGEYERVENLGVWVGGESGRVDRESGRLVFRRKSISPHSLLTYSQLEETLTGDS